MKIMILDEHTLLREGMIHLLARQRGFEIAETDLTADLLDQIIHRNLDVIIMDGDFFERPGRKLMSRVLRSEPQTAFLILETQEGHNLLSDAIKAGARGYMSATICLSELLAAVIAVAQGEMILLKS